MPGKPTGIGDALLAFAAEQAARAIESAGGGADSAQAAGRLLADAVTGGDQATVYAITNLLQPTYTRLGVNKVVLYQAQAQALEATGGASADGAAQLLPYVDSGGSGTLAGLVVSIRVVLMQLAAGIDPDLAHAVSIGGAFYGSKVS